MDHTLDALLAVARRSVANRRTADDRTWQQAPGAGWSDQQTADLFAHLAVNLFTSYFNQYNQTGLDLPPAP